jgi:hypothetical protein
VSVTSDPAHDPLVRRHAVAWGLVALGLVTIVAMAAHRPAWSNDRGGQVRSLPHIVTFAAFVGACIVAAALFLLSLAHAGARQSAEQRRRRWTTAIGFLVLLVVISIVRGFVHPSDHAGRAGSRPVPVAGGQASGSGGKNSSNAATWWPLVIVGLGSAAALVAATTRRRAKPVPASEIDHATVALLDASLDDLRREPDTRRAVIAAYARMEGGLAALGFPRDPSETPSEYLERAVRVGSEGPLAAHPVAVQALGELTALAERARFSTLPIDETMRARAIDALEHLRDELRTRAAAASPDKPADLGRVG